MYIGLGTVAGACLLVAVACAATAAGSTDNHANRRIVLTCEGRFERRLLIKVWGAGGGGATGNPTRGGAGGFIRGEICQTLGETWVLVVGGPGNTQLSQTECINAGSPNGGCAPSAGGGGGSSHVISPEAVVILGAGGGGGGADYGAGAGGGTCNGTVGQGGNGGGLMNSAEAGQHGGGGGGGATGGAASCNAHSGAGGGSGTDGQDSNGAGGEKAANYGGGGGGAASCLAQVSDCRQIDATNQAAVARDQLPNAYRARTPGAGGDIGTAGTAGAVVVEDAGTGEVLAAYFDPGAHQFSWAMSAEILDAYTQEHLLRGINCVLAGGVYNVSTVTCVAPAAAEPSTHQGVCANHSAGFVGLGGDGSLVLCPPAHRRLVRIGGTLQNDALATLQAENEHLYARLALLEERVGFATCAERHRQGGSAFTGAGVYELCTSSGSRFRAYCSADGWTLIRNQMDAFQYFTYNSTAKSLTSRTDAGVQSHLDHIVSAATMMRYTDADGIIMLEATFDGALYWKRASGAEPCGLVPVRYSKGPLAGVDRHIMVRPDQYWVHSSDCDNGCPNVAKQAYSVADVVGTNTWVCLENLEPSTRPFAAASCTFNNGPSFCPGYDPPYQFPANSGKSNGGFLYQQWVY